MALPPPPDTYQAFVKRYPLIGRAWDAITEQGRQGPLDDRTARLVKLGIAIGAMRQGAVNSNIRKAQAAGASREELEQVIALAAGTIGLPSAVAVFTWLHDTFPSPSPPERGRGA